MYNLTNGEFGLPLECATAVCGDPKVNATIVEDAWHDASSAQHGDDLGLGPRRRLVVTPTAIGLLVRHKVVRGRIRMIAEARTGYVDLLAAEHVAEAWPHEQRAVRVLVLASGGLYPLVDAKDEATLVVHV